MVNPTNSNYEDLARRLADRESQLSEARRQLAEVISSQRLEETRAELKFTLDNLKRQSKTLRDFHGRIADALAYCRQHAHPGINPAAHVYLNRVIEILDPEELRP